MRATDHCLPPSRSLAELRAGRSPSTMPVSSHASLLRTPASLSEPCAGRRSIPLLPAPPHPAPATASHHPGLRPLQVAPPLSPCASAIFTHASASLCLGLDELAASPPGWDQSDPLQSTTSVAKVQYNRLFRPTYQWQKYGAVDFSGPHVSHPWSRSGSAWMKWKLFGHFDVYSWHFGYFVQEEGKLNGVMKIGSDGYSEFKKRGQINKLK